MSQRSDGRVRMSLTRWLSSTSSGSLISCSDHRSPETARYTGPFRSLFGDLGPERSTCWPASIVIASQLIVHRYHRDESVQDARPDHILNSM
jgi:hypothetical protein